MTEPERLLESECDAFEGDLLRAGRRDAMSASSKRALVAAALGGGLAVTAGAQTAASASAAKVGTTLLAKWAALGLLGVALAVGAGLLVTRTPDASTPASAPASIEPRAVTVAPPDPSAPAPSAPSPATSAAIAEVAPAPSSVRRAAPSATSTAPAPSSAADLAAEAALLDEARDAVARRDGAAALALLAQHARAYPHPSLGDEAFVLRTEALSAQGDSARVRAIATPWLETHATSPYAARVRRALAQAGPSP